VRCRRLCAHAVVRTHRRPRAAEWYTKVEHENRLLLGKMSEIMTRPRALEEVNTSISYGHSLNRCGRGPQ